MRWIEPGTAYLPTSSQVDSHHLEEKTVDLQGRRHTSECKERLHYYCTKLPLYNLMCLLKTTRKYTCEKCYVSKYLDEAWENIAREAQKAIDEQAFTR